MKTMTQEGGLWQDGTSPLWTEWASRSPHTASGRMVRNGLWWNRYQKQLNEITIPKKLGCCVKHSHWFGIHRLPVWCYSSVVFQNNLLYHGSCSGEIDRFLLFGFEVRWHSTNCFTDQSSDYKRHSCDWVGDRVFVAMSLWQIQGLKVDVGEALNVYMYCVCTCPHLLNPFWQWHIFTVDHRL